MSAAAELLAEGGFEAVRHRAVARRAGLPLASTTYYFSSLDDLIARAVEHIAMIEVAQLRSRVSALSRRRRGPETIAEVLADLLVGDVSGPGLTEQLISRYERHPTQERHPRGVQALVAQQRDELVEHHRAAVLAGRPLVPVAAAAVDGDHRERRQPGIDGLGQTLLDAVDLRGEPGAVAILGCGRAGGLRRTRRLRGQLGVRDARAGIDPDPGGLRRQRPVLRCDKAIHCTAAQSARRRVLARRP